MRQMASNIPTALYRVTVGNEDLSWRSASLTPDSSPFDGLFGEHTFPDSDPCVPYTFNRPMDDIGCAVSTALGQMGDISLHEHNHNATPYTGSVSPPQLDCSSGTGHKTNWLEYSNTFDHSYESVAKSPTDPNDNRFLRQNTLLPIETGLRPGPLHDRPLSSISEQSTINSTPVHSSQGSPPREWPVPYHARKRSSSASLLGNNHIVSYQSRKRSSSDLGPGDAAYESLATPRIADTQFLCVSADFDHQSTWSPAWPTQPTVSPADFLTQGPHSYPTDRTPAGSSQNVGFFWPPNHPHSPGTPIPSGFNHDDGFRLSPSPYSPNEDGNQGVFRQRVASEAVMKAAVKKRKNNGKVFTCHICSDELTTKQNLNYHIDAHNGVRKFPCDTCNKRFGTPHVRNRHKLKCRPS